MSSKGPKPLSSTAPSSVEPIDTLPTPINMEKSRKRSTRAASSQSHLGPDDALKISKASHKENESRTFSGDTLVDHTKNPSPEQSSTEKRALEEQVDGALDMDWNATLNSTDLPQTTGLPNLTTSTEQRPTTASSALNKISKVAGKVKSVLGKRGRDAVETSKEMLGLNPQRNSSRLRALESTPAPSSAASEDSRAFEPTSKRQRTHSDAPSDTASYAHHFSHFSHGSSRKRYENAGLYVGQTEESYAHPDARKKRKSLPPSTLSKRDPVLPLPLFGTLNQTIDFHIPFDIFAPLTKPAMPKEWRKLNTNRFVDDARDLWRVNKLARSECGCKPPSSPYSQDGCDERCLNRTMLYECDTNNCALQSDQCTNRAFEQLATRMKRGGDYQHGIEIFQTSNRGCGIRASRSFAPGQIIVEYCGEIITPEECDRRMNEEYKDKNCYYLMDFDQGMIIDATRGNIARFVNHACEPNCRMEKRIVKGEPKMALFAGPNGIMTGQELTYDYNFDNFSSLNVLDCCCGSSMCRGKLDRRDAKRDKESLAASLKRKAADLLSDAASTTAQPLKRRKTARWSKGWAYADPKMEATRLYEDSLETGKSIDADRIAALSRGRPRNVRSESDSSTNRLLKSGHTSRQESTASIVRRSDVSVVSAVSRTRPQSAVCYYPTTITSARAGSRHLIADDDADPVSKRLSRNSLVGRAASRIGAQASSTAAAVKDLKRKRTSVADHEHADILPCIRVSAAPDDEEDTIRLPPLDFGSSDLGVVPSTVVSDATEGEDETISRDADVSAEQVPQDSAMASTTSLDAASQDNAQEDADASSMAALYDSTSAEEASTGTSKLGGLKRSVSKKAKSVIAKVGVPRPLSKSKLAV